MQTGKGTKRLAEAHSPGFEPTAQCKVMGQGRPLDLGQLKSKLLNWRAEGEPQAAPESDKTGCSSATSKCSDNLLCSLRLFCDRFVCWFHFAFVMICAEKQTSCHHAQVLAAAALVERESLSGKDRNCAAIIECQENTTRALIFFATARIPT